MGDEYGGTEAASLRRNEEVNMGFSQTPSASIAINTVATPMQTAGAHSGRGIVMAWLIAATDIPHYFTKDKRSETFDVPWKISWTAP